MRFTGDILKNKLIIKDQKGFYTSKKYPIPPATIFHPEIKQSI